MKLGRLQPGIRMEDWTKRVTADMEERQLRSEIWGDVAPWKLRNFLEIYYNLE